MTETQEQQLRKELDRGAKARAVLDSELFQEAVKVIEDDTLTKWKISPIRDVEGREALRLKWQVIQEIVTHLKDVMMTGKMASQELNRKLTLVERVKRSARGLWSA